MRVWKQFRDMASDEAAIERDLTPIAGVDFDLYVELFQALAEHFFDPAMAPQLAADRGVAFPDWQSASLGWQDRMRLNVELCTMFDDRYLAWVARRTVASQHSAAA